LSRKGTLVHFFSPSWVVAEWFDIKLLSTIFYPWMRLSGDDGSQAMGVQGRWDPLKNR